MFQKENLGMEEAKAAIDAMLQEALNQPEQPVAIAIVDSTGRLLHYVSMDGANQYNQSMAIKKAITAIQTRVDTQSFGAGLKMINLDLVELGSAELTTVPGGVVVTGSKGEGVLGGIGVAGYLLPQMDEHLARIGLEAIMPVNCVTELS